MIKSKISELIGKTPLLKLESLSNETEQNIYVKCEHLNPGGSVKDRTALGIIKAATKNGFLKPGYFVIEGTAGNTGIGLALLANEFNYRCVIVMPNNQSKEKYTILKALNVELITVPPCPFSNPLHFYHQAAQLSKDRTNSFWVNQFENTDNYNAHFNTTGPEIWNDLEGKIDAFVSSVGTGGTISGVSNYLKEQNKDIHIRMVDPMGSGLYHYFYHKQFKSEGQSISEGIGIMRLTKNFALAQVDSADQVTDDQMKWMFNKLSKEESLIVGTSAAINIFGAYKLALEWKKENIRNKNIVTVLCDSGLRYADKLLESQ